jgi:uncharacterized protein YbaA (DUF1428 family)
MEVSMYIVVMAIPVANVKKSEYKKWTKFSAKILQRYGCLQIKELWGDWIPEGKVTDFKKAVHAKNGENIVLQWQYWPSKKVLLQAEKKMKADDAFNVDSEVPFEGQRLIVGGFKSFFTAHSNA